MEARSTKLKILDVLAVLLLLAASWMVFYYAPTERTMGDVQRIFYFHVATAWVGMIGFFVTFIASTLVLIKGRGNIKTLTIITAISVALTAFLLVSWRGTDNFGNWFYSLGLTLYLLGLLIGLLLKRDQSFWDIVAVSAVEVGLVFLFINIVSGSIWARPAWNTWWNWDPRLVTATIMELVYLAYLMLRQGIEDPDRRARFGAVYALLGFISVPLTFLSIRIWRTIHPVIIGSGDPSAEGSFNMTTDMRQTFFFSLLTFTVIGITLLWHRIRLGTLADKVEQLKIKVMR